MLLVYITEFGLPCFIEDFCSNIPKETGLYFIFLERLPSGFLTHFNQPHKVGWNSLDPGLDSLSAKSSVSFESFYMNWVFQEFVHFECLNLLPPHSSNDILGFFLVFVGSFGMSPFSSLILVPCVLTFHLEEFFRGVKGVSVISAV